jgi:hypothetical protein
MLQVPSCVDLNALRDAGAALMGINKQSSRSLASSIVGTDIDRQKTAH